VRPTRRVLIVLPEEVHLMDVAGPAQVFVNAADIGALAEAGLFGLEIGHRDNTDLDTLEKLAERHRLVRTGSSDYHGSGKPNRLGENTTAPEVLRALASGCFLEVIHS